MQFDPQENDLNLQQADLVYQNTSQNFKDEFQYSFSLPSSPIRQFKPSRIYQKYLAQQSDNTNSQSNTMRHYSHNVSYSQRKQQRQAISNTLPFTSKYSKKTNKQQKNTQTNLQLNPIESGLSTLQIDKDKVLQEMVDSQNKDSYFKDFGMKQSKAMGKQKSQRQYTRLIQFLKTGKLPQEYIQLFQKMLA